MVVESPLVPCGELGEGEVHLMAFRYCFLV